MKMRTILKAFIIINLFIISSCTDLDLNPLSEASSETWYKEADQFEMSLNDIFKEAFWKPDGLEWIDDWVYRTNLYPITGGTINSEWGFLSTRWTNKYKAITRANTILNTIEEAEIPSELKDQFIGNASFVRAAQYAYLINHWGDVVYYTETLSLEDAFNLGRTDKATILQEIYKDFDVAISKLPVSYSGKQFATKGAALAMKARVALYQQDWAVARDAAKECMDLGVYELFPDYGELFRNSTKNSSEIIFAMPASEQFEVYNHWPGINGKYVPGTIPRYAGGYGNNYPSFELFCAYPCTDGLPIDESPLFNPREPFENRDPRLSETIVPFGAVHCGHIFYTHPDSLKILNVETGKYVNNRANVAVDRYAPWVGLLWRKGMNEYWYKNRRNQSDLIIMRYADLLLMYAEAKIELNEIDQSVLDAINKVRARAYQVDFSETSSYPAITATDQSELRRLLRNERRIELAFEDRRYMDIIRWRIAEKVLNLPTYGILASAADIKERYADNGLWFFPMVPQLDEDWIADFSPFYDAGYFRILSRRQFDASRQYLWPIPNKEILINDNLVQNPNY